MLQNQGMQNAEAPATGSTTPISKDGILWNGAKFAVNNLNFTYRGNKVSVEPDLLNMNVNGQILPLDTADQIRPIPFVDKPFQEQKARFGSKLWGLFKDAWNRHPKFFVFSLITAFPIVLLILLAIAGYRKYKHNKGLMVRKAQHTQGKSQRAKAHDDREHARIMSHFQGIVSEYVNRARDQERIANGGQNMNDGHGQNINPGNIAQHQGQNVMMADPVRQRMVDVSRRAKTFDDKMNHALKLVPMNSAPLALSCINKMKRLWADIGNGDEVKNQYKFEQCLRQVTDLMVFNDQNKVPLTGEALQETREMYFRNIYAEYNFYTDAMKEVKDAIDEPRLSMDVLQSHQSNLMQLQDSVRRQESLHKSVLSNIAMGVMR